MAGQLQTNYCRDQQSNDDNNSEDDDDWVPEDNDTDQDDNNHSNTNHRDNDQSDADQNSNQSDTDKNYKDDDDDDDMSDDEEVDDEVPQSNQTNEAQNLHNDDNGSLYANAPVSVKITMILIIAFIALHKLTKETISDLLYLLNIMCPTTCQCLQNVYKF